MPDMWEVAGSKNSNRVRDNKERRILRKALLTIFKNCVTYKEYTLPKRMDAYEHFSTSEEEAILDRINCFRIDAVAVDRSGTHHIIEAKVKLDPEALGQLLCYAELYKRKNKLSDADIQLHVVAGEDEPVLQFIFEKYGVKVHILKGEETGLG